MSPSKKIRINASGVHKQSWLFRLNNRHTSISICCRVCEDLSSIESEWPEMQSTKLLLVYQLKLMSYRIIKYNRYQYVKSPKRSSASQITILLPTLGKWPTWLMLVYSLQLQNKRNLPAVNIMLANIKACSE